MQLTVVAGAAAGHAALGRCSSVVLHVDDVWVVCGVWCVVMKLFGVVVVFVAGFGAAKAFSR